jgi:hypothetical protein
MTERASRLTLDEALAMLEAMAANAERMQEDPDDNSPAFWEGWEGGLLTLKQHIETGVKTTCFPIGSCACHPVNWSAGFPARNRSR